MEKKEIKPHNISDKVILLVTSDRVDVNISHTSSEEIVTTTNIEGLKTHVSREYLPKGELIPVENIIDEYVRHCTNDLGQLKCGKITVNEAFSHARYCMDKAASFGATQIQTKPLSDIFDEIKIILETMNDKSVKINQALENANKELAPLNEILKIILKKYNASPIVREIDGEFHIGLFIDGDKL